MQPDEGQRPDPRSSEDCLHLNVTAPRTVGRSVPIMVWFHGGAFSSGAGSDYQARRLVTDGDVAVVTVNSRLGVLGYFGHPDLVDSGTFGLADQQAALRWVRANATAFDGDPERVTVVGNSSGAANICAQLVSPASAGLFHRAIVQSGSCRQQWPAGVMIPGSAPLSYWTTAREAGRRGVAAAESLGCEGPASLDCLRGKTPEELLSVNGQFLTMAYGTPVLPGDPRERIRKGEFNRVPVLQGNTRDEHRLFARFFGIADKGGNQQYRSLVRAAFPDRAKEIVRRYPTGRGGQGAELAWAAVGTDSSWVCPTLHGSRELSRWVPTFSFEFADPHPPADPLFPVGFPTGSPHGSEVPYLFDLGPDPYDWNESQKALSKRMINYWASFARDGNPAPAADWAPMTPESPTTLQLRPDGDRVVRAGTEHQCDFWTTDS